MGWRPGPNLPPAATTTEQPRVSPAAVSPRPGSPPSLPRAGPSPRSLRGTRTLQRSRVFERAALAGRQGGAGARALARGLNRSTADCGRARDDGPTTPELSLSNARQPELRLSDATRRWRSGLAQTEACKTVGRDRGFGGRTDGMRYTRSRTGKNGGRTGRKEGSAGGGRPKSAWRPGEGRSRRRP